ncbi:hypothetical protein [Streptomyces sp. NPDC048584]
MTGLRPQPLRPLRLAADLHPVTFDLARLLPGTSPSGVQQVTPERP